MISLRLCSIWPNNKMDALIKCALPNKVTSYSINQITSKQALNYKKKFGITPTRDLLPW